MKLSLHLGTFLVLLSWEAARGPSLGLVQASEALVPCQIDSDCVHLNSYFECRTAPDDSKYERVCEHKDVFPLTTKEWIGTFVFALVMLLSTVAGIGGGGVAIPLAMYFFNLSMKPAIAVSSFSIMVTTTSRWIFSLKERHPEKPNVVCLDYGMASVMMPLTLLGSMVGAYFYNSFPDLVLQVLLTCLLAFLAYTSVKKGIQITKKENEELARKAAIRKLESKGMSLDDSASKHINQVQPEEATPSTDVKSSQESDSEILEKALASGSLDEITKAYNIPTIPTGDEDKDQEVQELRSLVRSEMGHTQWKKQGFNLLCLLVLIGVSLIRSGKWDLRFDKCSAADWGSVAAFICLLSIVVYMATMTLSKEHQLKKKYGNVNMVPSDLAFEGRVLQQVLALGFGGGWVAGALGLGGGVIYNPLLLQMGVPPKVSSATGLYLVQFSTISTCVLYFIFGELRLDYALWIGGWSALGGVLGAKGASWYMAKFGRQSIIVWVLNFMLVVSVIGVPYFGALDLVHEYQNGIDIMAFKSFCT